MCLDKFVRDFEHPMPKYYWKIFRISQYKKTYEKLVSRWEFYLDDNKGHYYSIKSEPQNIYHVNRWNNAKYKSSHKGIHCYLNLEDAIKELPIIESNPFNNNCVIRKVLINKILAKGFIIYGKNSIKCVVTDRIFIFDEKRSNNKLKGEK